MKNTLVLLLFAAFCQPIFAQTTAAKTTPAPAKIDEAAARKAADALAAKYSLSADQAKQMFQIQARKLRSLAEIEPLRAENPAGYNGKALSIQQNTTASIRQILQSKEQVEIFQKTQADLRAARAAKRKELTSKNASKEAVDAALLDVYQE